MARQTVDVLLVHGHQTILYVVNGSREGVVVGLAVDVGLVEFDAIGPLFGSALVAVPAEPVAGPVGGGGTADHEPHIAALGWALEGQHALGLVIRGPADVAVDAGAVLLQGHEAVAPASPLLLIGRVALLACLAHKLYVDGLARSGCIESDGIVAPVLDAFRRLGAPESVVLLVECRLVAESDAACSVFAYGVEVEGGHACTVLPHFVAQLTDLLQGGSRHEDSHVGLQGVFGTARFVPKRADGVHAVLVAEVVLDEEVVVAQGRAEGMAVQTVDGVAKPVVTLAGVPDELHMGIELVGLPLGTHLPKDVQRGRAPVVHPSVLVVVVAVGLILEAVAYLVGHGLSGARGVGAVGEGEQPYLVVDAAAAGFPVGGVAQADNHLVGVGLRLALVDGDELQAVGIEFEDAVGILQDARNGSRSTGAVACLPEDNPVLRLQGTFVAPLVVGVLQLTVGAAGAGTAVNFLVNGGNASVQCVCGRLQLGVGQCVVLHLFAGRLDGRLETLEGVGLARYAFPPADNLLGISDALAQSVVAGTRGFACRYGCLQFGVCGCQCLGLVGLDGRLACTDGIGQALRYRLLHALVNESLCFGNQILHLGDIALGRDGTHVLQFEVVDTQIVACSLFGYQTYPHVFLTIDDGERKRVLLHGSHGLSGVASHEVGSRLSRALVGRTVAAGLLDVQG